MQVAIFYEIMLEAAVGAFLKSPACDAVLVLALPLTDDAKTERVVDAFVAWLDDCENGDDLTVRMAAVSLKLLTAYKVVRSLLVAPFVALR